MWDMSFPVLSWSKTSLFPFFTTWLTDRRAFFTLATCERSWNLRCWPSSVQISNFLCPSLYTLLPSAVLYKSCAPDPSDSFKGWLVNQSTGMTVSPAPESTTRGFGICAQVFCWSSHRSVLPFSKKLMPASVRLEKRFSWLLDGEISRSLPLRAISLTTTGFVTDIVFQGDLFWSQAIRCCVIVSVLFLWINKEFDVCFGWCRSSHAAEFGNVFDGNAPLTVSHGFLLSRRFHHENIMLFRVTFQIVRSCWPLLLRTFAWRVPTFTFRPSLSDSPTFTVIATFAVSLLSLSFSFFHLLHNRTWPNDLTFHSCSRCRWNFHFCPSLCVASVPILSPVYCVLIVIQVWITVRPSVWTWRGTLTVLVQCFPKPCVQRRMCCFWWKQGLCFPSCGAQLCPCRLVFPSLCGRSQDHSCTPLWRWRLASVHLEIVEHILWPTSWSRSASEKIPQSGWVATTLGVDWQWRLRLARSSRRTGRWVCTELLLLS